MVTGKTNWLITGGCGFIGTSLIKNLLAEGGHSIRVLDNLSVGTRADLSKICTFSEGSKDHENVQLFIGDVTNEKTCLDAATGMDVIVHLAANTGVLPSVKNPRMDMVSNVVGTFNMLEAARHNQVKRFIFASSGAPAGECEPPIHEELAPHPVSPYGASKLAGEGYCSAYFKAFGVETVALRFGNVYGPGSGHKNSVVAKFIKLALKGETLEIYGDGNQTRDFIFIDDLIQAVRQAQSVAGIGGETFQIATNKETTVLEMVNVLVPILEMAGVNNIKTKHGAKQAGDVMRNFSDTSKANGLLGWKANYSLKKGLSVTVETFSNSASKH